MNLLDRLSPDDERSEEERVRYAGQNANGWIKELDELRAYTARATGFHAAR